MVISKEMADLKGTICMGLTSTPALHKNKTRNVSNIMKNVKKTKAEFKKLKTILPSVRMKENVSKLDIVLEAIKYIDDLQEQLMDRLSGPHLRVAASTSTSASSQPDDNNMIVCLKVQQQSEDILFSFSKGNISDPELVSFSQDIESNCSDYGSEDGEDKRSITSGEL